MTLLKGKSGRLKPDHEDENMAVKKINGVGSIEGVGPMTEKKLISGGYDTLEKIADAKPGVMHKKCNVTLGEAKSIIKNAKTMFDPRTAARLQRQIGKDQAELARLQNENYTLELVCDKQYQTIKELTELNEKKLIELLEKRLKKMKVESESGDFTYISNNDCPRDLYR